MTISPDSLHLEYTLVCGQAFRWRKDYAGWWVCALHTGDGPRLLKIRQDEGCVGHAAQSDVLVRDYFRADVDLEELAIDFLDRDPGLTEALERFRGLRVLRQDPVECLFGFMCTSAAPLHRIRKSVCGLCTAYGENVADVDGTIYDAFPEAERLAEASVEAMYGMGLGYRGRFVRAAAEAVVDRGGSGWLRSLRDADYATSHAELCRLPGVGPKIADCVCLFSLDKDDAIPVDTHIWQVAVRRYGIAANAKSMTPSVYREIADSLRDKFGPYAGWAQQYLFFEDLYERGSWGAYIKQLG